MKEITLSNGRKVSVTLSGFSGADTPPPLVLLHGFCEDSGLWNEFIPGLNGYPVVAMDLPGFGASDLPHEPTVRVYAQAVAETVDGLGIRRFVLAGHSLGGYVALEYAAFRVADLAGLVLFHSHPFADNEDRKQARNRGIEMLRSGKRDLYVAQLFPNLFSPEFAAAHPEVVSRMIETGKKHSPEGIISALVAMRDRPDRQEVLAGFECPVLFLTGDRDQLLPLPQAWQAAMLPAIASVCVLEGVAHMGMFEAPGAALKGLLEFCELPFIGG